MLLYECTYVQGDAYFITGCEWRFFLIFSCRVIYCHNWKPFIPVLRVNNCSSFIGESWQTRNTPGCSFSFYSLNLNIRERIDSFALFSCIRRRYTNMHRTMQIRSNKSHYTDNNLVSTIMKVSLERDGIFQFHCDVLVGR